MRFSNTTMPRLGPDQASLYVGSQIVLGLALVGIVLSALPGSSVDIAFVGLPLAAGVFVGINRWRRDGHGALMAIVDSVILGLSLIILLLYPWSGLQHSIPGEAAGTLLIAALAAVGIAGALLSPTTRSQRAARSRWQYVVVVGSQSLFVAILVGTIVSFLSAPDNHGPVGLVIPLFGGPALLVVLALASWLDGGGAFLFVADLILFGLSFLLFVVRLLGAEGSGAVPIGIAAICAGVGVLASRWYDAAPARRSSTPAA